MKANETYINQVLSGFQKYKGRASIYCFSFNIIPELVYNVLHYFKAKNGDIKIFIVVDEFKTRKAILDYIAKAKETFNVKILSKTYVSEDYKQSYNLVITIGINDNYSLLSHLYYSSTFMLSIFTKSITDAQFINIIRKILPDIEVDNYVSMAKSEYINSPVEGRIYSVELTNEAREEYKKCTDKINHCIAIFGSIDNIHKARDGDKTLNISSQEFRTNLAYENGWNNTIDPEIEFQKQIDEVYNPTVLYEDAYSFFNNSKLRRDIVSDNENKLSIIAKICTENKDKRILIISKHGEFAAKITEYLNINCGIKCGDYHDCIPTRPAIKSNGEPILVKSGVRKGRQKMLGSKAQSSQFELLFQQGYINVLSIKESSSNSLEIACDLIILTTPLYSTIQDIKTRFNNVKITTNPNIVYYIYTENSIEEIAINKLQYDSRMIIQNLNDAKTINYDEENGAIIL